MRARCHKDAKPTHLDNGIVFPNGTQNIKSQLFTGGNQELKKLERSITVPKKRKIESAQGAPNKTVRTSNEGIGENQRPCPLQEESDVPEHDSPSEGLYVNENSLEEAEEGSFEGNEHFYEKEELDDEDGGDE